MRRRGKKHHLFVLDLLFLLFSPSSSFSSECRSAAAAAAAGDPQASQIDNLQATSSPFFFAPVPPPPSSGEGSDIDNRTRPEEERKWSQNRRPAEGRPADMDGWEAPMTRDGSVGRSLTSPADMHCFSVKGKKKQSRQLCERLLSSPSGLYYCRYGKLKSTAAGQLGSTGSD